MADYVPYRLEADEPVYTASATITGGQLVAISGNLTIAPAGANSTAWVGVAAFDALSGDRVTVYAEGEHDLVASGAIAAGAVVIPAASGAVQTIAAVTDYSQALGVAVSAAGSGRVRVLFR